MSKNKKVVFTADAASATGFVPDPSLQPLNLAQTRLDVSDVGLDDDQQLWLLQLPHDFPVGASVSWAISDDPAAGGLRGRCTVQGVEYLLVPEDAALTASLYATPSSAQGCVAPIARRMTVVRASQAPLLCFGDDGKQQQPKKPKRTAAAAAGKQQGSGVAAALSPADDKSARKKKRRSEAAAAAQQQQQQQQEPQRQQQDPGAAQAAGAAPAAEQQQAEGSAAKQQKKKAKRKHEQGEAAAAAAVPEAAALPSAEKKAKRKKSKGSEKP